MWRVALVLVVGCKPSGVTTAHELCAKATKMYAQCEKHEGMQAQEWELRLDRWQGLCRAVITGETKQLLPDGLQIYTELSDEARAGLKVQAECTAVAKTCDDYRACDK